MKVYYSTVVFSSVVNAMYFKRVVVVVIIVVVVISSSSSSITVYPRRPNTGVSVVVPVVRDMTFPGSLCSADPALSLWTVGRRRAPRRVLERCVSFYPRRRRVHPKRRLPHSKRL